LNAQNLNRIRAKQLVELSPGIHLRMLQRLLGASFSTTRYHVFNLERDGEIVCLKDGRHNRLYPVGLPDSMKAAHACLQNKTARRVLQGLVDCPSGIASGSLAERLGLPGSTTSECVSLLGRAGLVSREFTVEGQVVYRPKDRELATSLLATFKRNMLAVATDSFIDLWGEC
jgi:predicted transcriptional regulator